LVSWLEVWLDTVIVFASLGLSVYGYRLLRFFRKGIFQRAFEFLICSALVFVAAESFHILEMFTQTGIFEGAHILFEVAFVLLMFHSFGLLYKAWVPIERHRK